MTAVPLTVVMPVRDEPGVLAVVADVHQLVLDAVPGSTMVIVDDASSPPCAGALAALAGDRITVLRNEQQSGHGPSVRRGLDTAAGEWVLHLDSDGQCDVGAFTALWAARDAADLVIGRRATRRDPAHRTVLTRAASMVASRLAGQRVPDANAPLRLVRRSLFQHLAGHVPAATFAPQVSMTVLAVRAGARVRWVDVAHLERTGGRSTLRPVRLVRAAVRSAVETWRITRGDVEPFER